MADVRYWHKADISVGPINCPLLDQSGCLFQEDQRTSAVTGSAIEQRIIEPVTRRRYSALRSHFGRSFFIQARSLRTTLEFLQ